MDRDLHELGFYALAGSTNTPRDLIAEVRDGERLGLGAAFISERFNVKDAPTLCGAAAVASERLGIATAATNHNTRHPLVTATFAATMQALTGDRFALGFGRGVEDLWRAMNLPPVRNAQLEDIFALLRQLWSVGYVAKHDGAAGQYPYLYQGRGLPAQVPLMMVAMGPRTLELSGALCDGVVLHTFFSEHALTEAVAAIRRGAQRAGRDPAAVRVWSVLATIGDNLDDETRLRKTVGRMATYLQGYGDALVAANGWDPAVLGRLRASEVFTSARGAFDAGSTVETLLQLQDLIPAEWLSAAATGSAEQCATKVRAELDLGADSVILHGVTPEQLAPVIAAYRGLPTHKRADRCVANPGRFA